MAWSGGVGGRGLLKAVLLGTGGRGLEVCLEAEDRANRVALADSLKSIPDGSPVKLTGLYNEKNKKTTI